MSNAVLLPLPTATQQRRVYTRRFGELFEQAVAELDAGRNKHLPAGGGWEKIALGEFSPENFLRWSACCLTLWSPLLLCRVGKRRKGTPKT